MTVSLEEFLATFSTEERAEIEAGAAVLLDQHETLVELRKARKLAWDTLSRIQGEDPESIFSMERQADILLTAMGGYVEAMGGSLKLIAEFPGHAPYTLKLSDLPESTPETRRERRRRIRRAANAGKRRTAPMDDATAPDVTVPDPASTGAATDSVAAD